MALSGVLTLALALATGAGGDRILLCRPKVAGDPALARGEAVAEAGRRHGRFLDYGAVCEDAGEGARAARRMGLSHAVSSLAEGRMEGSRYVLRLSAAGEAVARAERTVDVAPGANAVRPLREVLAQLARETPAAPKPRKARIAAWTIAGAGAAAVAAGVVLAVRADRAADRANGATDAAAYVRAKDEWKGKRTGAGIALGAGGAALAAGLGWRFGF